HGRPRRVRARQLDAGAGRGAGTRAGGGALAASARGIVEGKDDLHRPGGRLGQHDHVEQHSRAVERNRLACIVEHDSLADLEPGAQVGESEPDEVAMGRRPRMRRSHAG
ncbi:MAG: hypothetical protein ACK559_39300, partial [bacterium]